MVVALTASIGNWDPVKLALLTALTALSDLTSVETGARKLRVSGSFLGIMLAAVLLGGGPAACIAVLAVSIGSLRLRERPNEFLQNLVTFAWFPLIAGLFFHAVVHLASLTPQDAGYYLLVFIAFMLALALNFVGIATYQCYRQRVSFAGLAREAVQPVLAAELFSDLLTIAAVYISVQLGTIGLAMFALVLVIFQYLVGELLTSKRRSEALHRMATTDELTGLANRESFRVRLEQQIESATQDGEGFAVLLMDLDRFKEINDTLGHHYGDALLRDLGPRLARHVGRSGLVARLGGDEFVVLPSRRTNETEPLEELAAELLGCVQEPFIADDLSLEVAASVGISRFPQDGSDVSTLLRRADVAMYAAKSAHSGYKLYDPDQDPNSVRRLNVLSGVRRGLDSDEMAVYYQPIVDLERREVRGAEGLVRWQHPEAGLVLPGVFIPLVEQTELIGPLTRHVLERAIAQCANWRHGGRDLTVAVNLSVRNLLDARLPADVEKLLARHSLDPAALHLEITESMLMSDPDRVLATVNRLSALGVSLSVDDFGTGYSSLANLRRLPINQLKIDRSFVTPMLRDESDLIIVRSTINLGHDLGLRVVAEGVEDASTLARLGTLGCDLVQGFHLSRPIAADAFLDWMLQFEQPGEINEAA